jgi:choline dehydrogenase
VPSTDDFNGDIQEGAGYFQLTTSKGWRVSTAKAYLDPARSRRNLKIETGAFAAGVELEGKRAVGVRWRQGGVMRSARARAEVLLSAGAIQSPQLLQLSGIGPGDLLARHGITVVHDSPGVGENLQDHLQVRATYESTRPTTNDALNSWFGQASLGLQWLLHRSGPLAVGINQGGCFMRALPRESTTPDIQFHVATLSADMAGGQVHPYSGFTMSTCQLRPESRGHVRLRSTDPFEPPEIQPNYLATDLDRRTTVAGLKATRAIVASDAMRPFVKREVKPGVEAESDEALLEFCRDHGATIFHPSGTCKMGDDALAVLDDRLRVHGIERLRVVDCSAMPTLVSGNTNAPAVMMAEKAVDMIREDRRRAA